MKKEKTDICIPTYDFNTKPCNINVSWTALEDSALGEARKREEERARYSYKMTNVTVKLHAKDKRDVVFDLTKTFYTKVFRYDKGVWTIYAADIHRLIRDSFEGTDIVDWWYDREIKYNWDGTPYEGMPKWKEICNLYVKDTPFGEE